LNRRYHVKYTDAQDLCFMGINDARWLLAETARIDHFHPSGSEHRPETAVNMLYNSQGIFLRFSVRDRYVRSLQTRYNSKVQEDSCVECFIRPPQAAGYYNFEINAGGTLHVNYIIDPERDESGKRKNVRPIPEELASKIRIAGTLPKQVDPEIKVQVDWAIAVFIPFAFFELYSPVTDPSSEAWRGNFYKCGDKTSHPHWACWNPITSLNFHNPACFGELLFDV
jgi:hypothetical protein